jgi:hypothetical protein
MKNVTVALDEALAKWARVEAAKAGKSLSRWIGERLQHEMDGASDRTPERQRKALERFLSGPGYPSIAANLSSRADCGIFVSEDLDDGRVIEGMRIVDPLRHEIDGIQAK